MADAKTHAVIGAAAAGGASLYFAREQQPADQALEFVGGMLSGYWSSSWPDVLEPAFHPNHRGPAHAAIPNLVVWSAYSSQVESMQEMLRQQSNALAYQAQNSTGIVAVVDAVLAAILRILAGAVIGIPAGYVSHVVVDSFTPKGIGATGI